MTRCDPAAGEKRLLWAMLLQAINLLEEAEAEPQRRRTLEVIEARQWLFDDTVLLPLSFVHVAEYLGLSPVGVRRIVNERLAIIRRRRFVTADPFRRGEYARAQ